MCAVSLKAKTLSIFLGAFQKFMGKFQKSFLNKFHNNVNAYVYQSPVKKSPLARFLLYETQYLNSVQEIFVNKNL